MAEEPAELTPAKAREEVFGDRANICRGWPDPPPRAGCPGVDDVSRLNATGVSRIFEVRGKEDVKRVLHDARHAGVRVSMRGTQHSMGGHTIAEGGYVIDTRRLNHVQYRPQDAKEGRPDAVVCGPGCLWADLVVHLNQYGRAPRTMQSYSTFSVGGTLAVNGHGITTDFTVSESVRRFNIVLWDGREVECSREAESEESRELFKHVIGGYGLFGVVVDIEMLCDPNHQLDVEHLIVNTTNFPKVYEGVLEATDEIDVKIARLNILTLDKVDIFLYRKGMGPTVSRLEIEPREMGMKTKLLYKWLMPTMKEQRYAVEDILGTAVDLGGETDRNSLLFESAVPLAQLYSPLWLMDDTFILQEFFVPRKAFASWIARVRPIYEDLKQSSLLSLLNTTIRFVNKDNDTALPYSRAPDGSYAFVLYYRLKRTAEADDALQAVHKRFAQATLDLGGTFYVPYRHHYDQDELLRSYPSAPDFFRMKLKYDPHGLFWNKWFAAYGLPLLSEEERKKFAESAPVPKDELPRGLEGVPPAAERRVDSYRRLLGSPKLRREFQESFLKNIFNVGDPAAIFGTVSKAFWLAGRDAKDIDVYRKLRDLVEADGDAISGLQKSLKQMWQLRAQKKELSQETKSTVARAGMLGKLHSYLSIGDNGKMVLPLREALGMTGEVWVAHDRNSDELGAALERGSADGLGKFVVIDYNLCDNLDVPTGAADLITMNQGLHHLPPCQLPAFLSEVVRILRPGGLFIVREHDASPELMPMLDLAHSVFNAMTGVPWEEEETEIRAFRSILEWRGVVEQSGLRDTMLYQVEKGDPTIDEMMCFYKPPYGSEGPGREVVEVGPIKIGGTDVPPQMAQMMAKIPEAVLCTGRDTVDAALRGFPMLREFVDKVFKKLSQGQRNFVNELIRRILEPMEQGLQRLRPFFEAGQCNTKLPEVSLVPAELFLVPQVLKRRRDTGKATQGELLALSVIEDIENFLTGGGDEEDEASGDVPLPKSASWGQVEVDEITAQLESVLEAIPELRDPSVLEQSGLPSSVQAFMVDFAGGRTVEDAAFKLATVLDTRAWRELREALEDVKKEKQVPNLRLITGGESAWTRSAMAVLGSPEVKISPGKARLARWAGLGDLVRMWEAAQKIRRQSRRSDEWEDGLLKELKSAIENPRPKEVTMEEGSYQDIQNVGEVISAKFGYKSLSRGYDDVTPILRKRLTREGALMLQGLDLFSMLGRTWMDHTRRGALGQTNKLIIYYKPLRDLTPEAVLPAAEALVGHLRDRGIVDKSHHKNNADYNWMKLPEWFQVEMLQAFGDSMEHTPWYRFPFLRFLRVYMEVLGQEVLVVSKRLGPSKLLSKSFVTSAVPAVVMTLLFGQMSMLAAPLKLALGEEYDDATMYEQLVLVLPPEEERIDWRQIDRRITERFQYDGVYVLHIPPFKDFTHVLRTIAETLPSGRLLQVSNHTELQVKVRVREAADLDSFHRVAIFKKMFLYKYPVDGTPNPPHQSASLLVQAPHLLSFIRECRKNGVILDQIFDFWG
eukprot:Hpha_TRINITY_DN14610_c2_g13::TRINITY_DN14610_c2_g13_i1::g.48367::m.48367